MKCTRILLVLILSCLLVFIIGCNQEANNDDASTEFDPDLGETGAMNPPDEKTDMVIDPDSGETGGTNSSEDDAADGAEEDELGKSDNTDEDTGSSSQEPTDDEKYEAMLVDMFVKYGEYEDGYFRFTKFNNIDNVSFMYVFGYNTSTKTFYCTSSVYSYALSPYCVEDYGYFSLTDKFLFGDHRLVNEYTDETVSFIEFEYNVSDTDSNSYTYFVRQNTYPNLNENEMDEHAQICFECIQQAITFAKSIIAAYLGVTLT